MVILSLTKNSTLENILKARSLLSLLEERYAETHHPELKPNAYPYNYVLMNSAACIGGPGDKLKAFHVATQTYNDLRNEAKLQPDSYTYSFFIKCANNLLPDGELRKKCIKLCFEQCCRDGLMNAAVLRRLLSQKTPTDVLVELLEPSESVSSASYRHLTLDDLPPQWSRNTR